VHFIHKSGAADGSDGGGVFDGQKQPATNRNSRLQADRREWREGGEIVIRSQYHCQRGEGGGKHAKFCIITPPSLTPIGREAGGKEGVGESRLLTAEKEGRVGGGASTEQKFMLLSSWLMYGL
jgi:hypothetical protein